MQLFDDSQMEESRLAALYRYDVLDSPPEEGFDRITRLAKAIIKTPTVLLSLVDRDRQWFKSRTGLDICETGRDVSFCSQAIRAEIPLVVPDATKDPRFRDNALVTGDPSIRFYLGVPLRTPEGHNIGTLCAIDYKPRDVQPGEIAIMEDLARLAVDQLELRQIATIDALTGALTRRAFMKEAARAFDAAQRHRRELACIMLDADHFKRINDRHGHPTGDRVLRGIAAACRCMMRSTDSIGRLGGEEFCFILPETSLAGARSIAERLRAVIDETEQVATSGARFRVTVSLGISERAASDATVQAMLDRADDALYGAKETGRNRVCAFRPTSLMAS